MGSTLERFEKAVKMHTLQGYDEFFSANAFLGEAGELANARKKLQYSKDYPSIRKALEGKNYQENSIDEAGDTFFFFLQWLQKVGISLEEVMEHQMKKLQQKSLDYGKTFKK